MKNLTCCTIALCAVLVLATVALGQVVTNDGPEGEKPPVRRAISPIVAALDEDGDGEISADEIAGAAESLKKLDKNNDGKISGEELRPSVTAVAATTEDADFVTRFFAKFDKNNDGKVSRDELSEPNQRLLDRGDTDKDGALDKAELEELTKTLGGDSSSAADAENKSSTPASS